MFFSNFGSPIYKYRNYYVYADKKNQKNIL